LEIAGDFLHPVRDLLDYERLRLPFLLDSERSSLPLSTPWYPEDLYHGNSISQKRHVST